MLLVQMFPIVIANVAYYCSHPYLQFVGAPQFVERGENNDERIVQQVFSRTFFLGVMPADVEKMWPVMTIEHVQGLTVASLAPAYQFVFILLFYGIIQH